jgi:glycosyltransferase involved in cell wall biosynthesis
MPEVMSAVLSTSTGRPVRVAHLTTVDVSLAVLLGTELEVDVHAGLETFALSAPGPFVPGIEELGVTHVPVPSLTRSWDLRGDAAATRELYQTLRELGPDVLHTHNPKSGVLGRMVGHRAGVPVVVNTCHGLWAAPDSPWLKRLAVYAVEACAAAFSDAELYQNGADRGALRHLVRGSKTEVVGNGIDLLRFGPDPDARRRVRQELALGEDDIVVGGVGRLVAEKGLREFAVAAHALRGRAKFVWVGSEDLERTTEIYADGREVRFLGAREDMAAVYNAFDVFVLPSYREGFSRSAMEAAATGLPSVLTDIRGCREIGADEVQLLHVPARDTEALVAAVGRLVEDAELRVKLGSAARRRALEAFDQRRVAARSLEMYAQVARRRGLGWHRVEGPS